MRSYAAARTYFSILEFVSWSIIVLGAIVALVAIAAFGQMSRSFGGSSMAGLAGLIPGASVVFAGFMGLVLAQIGRAGVDSAEYSQQMLKIARDQLEVSQLALRGGAKAETGFAALNKKVTEPTAAPPDATPQASYETAASEEAQIEHQPGEVIDYRGQTIRVVEAGYVVHGTVFEGLGEAKAEIDLDPLALPKEPPVSHPNQEAVGANGSEKV